jgi:SAM-dependent methyltransferase
MEIDEIQNILLDRINYYELSKIKKCLKKTAKIHNLNETDITKIILNNLLSNVGKFRLKTALPGLEFLTDKQLNHLYQEHDKIFHNITNLKFTVENTEKFALESKSKSKWGATRNISRSQQKFKKYTKFFPKNIEKVVDIGCGDGLDLSYIRQTYNIKMWNAVCADIKDERDPNYQKKTMHLKIELDKPMKIKNNSVDVVFLFHVIHHMMDNVYDRLNDIYRILKPGGILCVKDHDVRTKEQAINVSFQHYSYELFSIGNKTSTGHKGATSKETAFTGSKTGSGLKTRTVFDLAKNFRKEMPMIFYNSVELDVMLNKIGFRQIYFNKNKNLTYTFEAVYKKILYEF